MPPPLIQNWSLSAGVQVGLMRSMDPWSGIDLPLSLWSSRNRAGAWRTTIQTQSKVLGGPACKWLVVIMNIISGIAGGAPHVCCPTRSGSWGVSRVGEEHPWKWHMLNAWNFTFGEGIQWLNELNYYFVEACVARYRHVQYTGQTGRREWSLVWNYCTTVSLYGRESTSFPALV